MARVWILITLFALYGFVVCLAAKEDAMLLSAIPELHFHKGKKTTSRRTSAIQQLECVGGNVGCKKEYLPKYVRCYNRGVVASDVIWECRAELNVKVQFGATTVNCEGYQHPDDPYILAGSCSLEFTLDWNPRSEGVGNDALRLETWPEIHFDSRERTVGKRLKPRPQMQCVGGTTGCTYRYLPSHATCYNQGTDKRRDLLWYCDGNMSPEVQFGETAVVCEGYRSSSDEFVLAGSCRLEYTLDWADRSRPHVHMTGIVEDWDQDEDSLVGAVSGLFSAVAAAGLITVCAWFFRRRIEHQMPAAVHQNLTPAAHIPSETHDTTPVHKHPSGIGERQYRVFKTQY